MKDPFAEAGLRKAYQFFLILRLFFWTFLNDFQILFLNDGSGAGPLTAMQRLVLVMADLTFFLILVLPSSREQLGRRFYPVFNAATVLLLFLAQFWWEAGNASRSLLPHNPLISPFFILYFITLILYSWQHTLPVLMAYIAGVMLVNILTMLFLSPRSLGEVVVPYVVFGAVFFLVAWTETMLVSERKYHEKRLREAHAKERAINSRLAAAALAREELTISRERNRLARELHDTMAHSLSALSVQLEAARSVWDQDPARSREILGEARETVTSGLAEVRHALGDLRARPLEDLGLFLGCRELMTQGLSRLGAEGEIGVPDPSVPTGLAPHQEHGVYRILQEGVENMVRHSGASRATLVIRREEEFLLRLEDDGAGFSIIPPASKVGGLHYGLEGMKERALIIGGELEIRSAPGKGTSLILRIPEDRREAANV